jgi:HPt (histidine-containing phosphotransfer) domain-containing protein
MGAPETIVVHVDASIADLVPLFLEQRRADQRLLARALDAGDLAALRRAAHALTGASGSYGFDALTALGERLTDAARAGDIGQVRLLKRELDDYLARLIVKSL